MDEHRYILQPYKGISTRYTCPSCDHLRTFSRYIDTETGDHLATYVGRCDRLDKCGYHFTPKQYFADNPESKVVPLNTYRHIQKLVKPFSLIPTELFKASLKHYEQNNFIQFLIGIFGNEITKNLIAKYFIGTSNHWTGSTVFWQVDTMGRIRSGKIMLYYSDSGKRVKQPFNHISWVHSVMKIPDFELKQCFFGEHLLTREPLQPVGIVESEKTAIIASGYLPEMIWLAAGNKEGLSLDKCKVLAGRKVALFPDLNAFELWSKKAMVLSSLAMVKVSDLLESKATPEEKQRGLDLADYLVQFPLYFSGSSYLTVKCKK